MQAGYSNNIMKSKNGIIYFYTYSEFIWGHAHECTISLIILRVISGKCWFAKTLSREKLSLFMRAIYPALPKWDRVRFCRETNLYLTIENISVRSNFIFVKMMLLAIWSFSLFQDFKFMCLYNTPSQCSFIWEIFQWVFHKSRKDFPFYFTQCDHYEKLGTSIFIHKDPLSGQGILG